MFKIINDTKAPKAVGTYSQGSYYNGTYYFSGQIGLNPDNGEMRVGFEAQLEQILKNIDLLLECCHLTRKNI
jgi:2-iminobutanoate/2-iminopropanoate deaminase